MPRFVVFCYVTKANPMTSKRKKSPSINPVAVAVAHAGNQAALSKILGVSEAAVSKWVAQQWVPHRRAQEIEALYGLPRLSLINPRMRDLIEAGAFL